MQKVSELVLTCMRRAYVRLCPQARFCCTCAYYYSESTSGHAWQCARGDEMMCAQGKLEENTFVVLDAFALPVEGTETRVTALEEGYEYMVGYQTTCDASGRVEPVIGA